MKKGILYLLGSFVFILLLGFQKQDFSDRKALIQAKVDQRVEEYRLGIVKRCRDKVMKEAGVRVDSILIVQSGEIFTVDSIPRPTRPIKPNKPVVPLLEESDPIAPIIEKGVGVPDSGMVKF